MPAILNLSLHGQTHSIAKGPAPQGPSECFSLQSYRMNGLYLRSASLRYQYSSSKPTYWPHRTAIIY